MGNNNLNRRTALKALGTNSLAVSAVGVLSSPVQGEPDCPVPPCDGDPNPGQREEETSTDSYTGPEMDGNGDFTVTLASTVVEHIPVYPESLQMWECDISLSGIAHCQFVDDGAPAKEMRWHSCTVSNQKYDEDLYSRDDKEWCGIKIGEGREGPDYTTLSHIENTLALGVGALNPAAGTAIGAGLLLRDMIDEYGGGGIGRYWEVDSPLGGPTQHLTGYYHKYRAEMDPNGLTIHDLTDSALAYPELPVSNTFEIIMGAPNYRPDELSAREREEYGIRRYDPDDELAVQSASPHIQSAIDRHDEPIYVATDARQSITPKPNFIPDELREKFPEIEWEEN